jgi:hypothetical protein
VARIGDPLPGAAPCWFKIGDRVSIQPSLFSEIELTPTLSAWCGPIAAVTGVFVEEEPSFQEEDVREFGGGR